MTSASGRTVVGVRRRRAVALHADIADYSRLMADDTARTVTTVRVYQRLVGDAVAAAAGTLVNFVGDSFLAVFDDERAALRGATAICAQVWEHNRALPPPQRMWFRMGVDAGEIMMSEDGRHFGDPLNIAARVQALAEVGGVNVTHAVYQALDEPALRLTALGARRLKNIPELVRIYRLAGLGERTGPPVDRRDTTPSVAVMPTASADDAVARGIADALRLDLVQALVKIPGLRVVDAAARDADLGATYLLDSGVVRSGSRLRAYAEVMETDTVNPVWAERWDGTTDDVFALQDAVTAGTVRALEIDLVVGEPAMIYRAELDPAERDIVYRGWQQFMLGTPAGWRAAAELFTSLARSQPERITGTALAAFVHWWGAAQGLSDDADRDLERAAVFAARGIELDDDTGLSQMVSAALRLRDGGDLDGALRRAREALQRRPTCDVTYAVEGSVLRYIGDWQAAVAACQRALDLTPMPKRWYRSVLASAYYVGERYQDAADVAERVVDRDPGDLESLLVLTASQQALGLRRRARATADVIADRFPDFRRDDLPSLHPFRDDAISRRWAGHLADAGVG